MAEKTTAEKGTKAAAKPSQKVFDVSKPGKQSASATSRPVIVSSRPIMQDPMMLSNANVAESAANSSASPSSIKVTIKPLTDDEKKSGDAPKDDSAPKDGDSSKADDTPKDADTPKSADKKNAKQNDDDTSAKDDEDKPSSKPFAKLQPFSVLAEQKNAEASTEKSNETPADAPEPADPGQQPEAMEKGSKPAAKPDTDTPEPVKKNDMAGVPQDEAAPSLEPTKDEKQAAELEAAAKQQAALDELVASKQYFLPINSVEKRRSKITALLGLALIVGLGLLLVDLLMDVGVLRINGVEPLTHFFSS